ncbi:MAG TPA: MFS transporter [Polyangia bacterium]|jgi:MFS family permease|nr:MFS transporter [Polyangia bacterium]
MTTAAVAAAGPRKASLGTLFFTVFLDLLGFGLVIPFLPGLARDLGASNFVATLPGAAYSLMQFLFIPVWGRLSDRVGRRPVLLWSIAASSFGMAMLGFGNSLLWLFVARLWSGVATANIAVAQAYIADVTTPETRARGMGLIGMAFGLGFIFGPAVGGILSRYPVPGIAQVGALPALVASALSLINLMLALRTLPESLPPEKRGRSLRRAVPLDLAAFRTAIQVPGVGVAVATNFFVIMWFSGMEQTFRLFTDDVFGMTAAATGAIFTVVGVVSAGVQGGLVSRLVRRFGEARLIVAGPLILAVAFALLAASPMFGPAAHVVLYGSSGLIALGSGIVQPSLPSYVSRRAAATGQGLALGTLQSASALGRVVGPAIGGLLYSSFSATAPYTFGAVGLLFAAILAAARLPD